MIKKYDNVRIHLLRVDKRISCVYTRDLLCMHNTLVHALGQGPQGPGPKKGARSLVYTQEVLLSIHNKCINVTPGAMLRHYWPLLRHYWPLLRNYWPLLRHYCATIGHYCATIGHYCGHYWPLLRHYWRLFGAVAAEMNLP